MKVFRREVIVANDSYVELMFLTVTWMQQAHVKDDVAAEQDFSSRRKQWITCGYVTILHAILP